MQISQKNRYRPMAALPTSHVTRDWRTIDRIFQSLKTG